MPNQFYIHVEGVRDDCWCLSEVSWVWSRVIYWVGEPESYSAVTDRVWLLSQYEVKWRQNVSSCTWGAWPGWQRIYAKCLWRVIHQDRRVSQSRKGQIAPSSKVAKRHFRFSRGISQGGRLSGCPSDPGPEKTWIRGNIAKVFLSESAYLHIGDQVDHGYCVLWQLVVLKLKRPVCVFLFKLKKRKTANKQLTLKRPVCALWN